MNKVLVTGATGFIGSHLCELLCKQGYAVTAFDRYNPNSSFGWLETSECKNDINFVLGDIRDFDYVYETAKGHQHILHLAALIGIPYSYISPVAYIKTNIEGTYNVLQAGKLLDLENIIITSTSETYGSAQYTPIDESHPLVGQSPYSASKIGADQLSLSYFRSFDLPVKIIRPFNTYGPRQSARAIIPTIISQLLDKSVEQIKLGDMSPTRDLTYVLDTARAFEVLIRKGVFGEVYNAGNNSEVSIKQIYELCCKELEIKKDVITDPSRLRPSKSEVTRLVCNYEKISRECGWEPKFSIASGLSHSCAWIKDNQHNYNPDIYAV